MSKIRVAIEVGKGGMIIHDEVMYAETLEEAGDLLAIPIREFPGKGANIITMKIEVLKPWEEERERQRARENMPGKFYKL